VSILRKIYYTVSPSQRLWARRIAFFPVDLWEILTGTRSKNIPPRGMIYTGAGSFVKAGKMYLKFFRRYGNIEPDHRVLDIGSGIGRMALPLTEYLNAGGSYEGFDIVETGVKWCQENISVKYPNFRFRLIKLKNDLYSSEGQSAGSFRFPYPDDEFDFVFLTSVFTHMIPDEVENYMSEIHRTLKKGGKCFATFFIYGVNVSDNIIKKPYFSFPVDKGFYKLLDPKVQSANVAYDFNYVEKTLGRGLKLKSFIPGHWRGIEVDETRNDFQDIIVFEKT
jgi:SAM-dependent methyltransferase